MTCRAQICPLQMSTMSGSGCVSLVVSCSAYLATCLRFGKLHYYWVVCHWLLGGTMIAPEGSFVNRCSYSGLVLCPDCFFLCFWVGTAFSCVFGWGKFPHPPKNTGKSGLGTRLTLGLAWQSMKRDRELHARVKWDMMFTDPTAGTHA